MMAKDASLWFLDEVGESNNVHIVIADTTDNRLEHLNQIGIKAKFMKSNFQIDKKFEAALSPRVLAKTVAEEKVNDVADQLMKKNEQCDIIMGLHTVTVLDDKVVSKPMNREDAIMTLKKFNDREHSVVTGFAFRPREKKTQTFFAETKVKFGQITDEMLERYLKTDEWKHCNAVFDIYGKGAAFVKSTNGCLNNMGIPVFEIVKKLGKLLDRNSFTTKSIVEKKEEAVESKESEHEKEDIEGVAVVQKQDEEAVAAAQKPMNESEMVKNDIQSVEVAADQETNPMNSMQHHKQVPKNNAQVFDSSWEAASTFNATPNSEAAAADQRFVGTNRERIAPTRPRRFYKEVNNTPVMLGNDDDIDASPSRSDGPYALIFAPGGYLSRLLPTPETAQLPRSPAATASDFPQPPPSGPLAVEIPPGHERPPHDEYRSSFYRATGRPGISDLRRIGIEAPIAPIMPQHSYQYSPQDDWGQFTNHQYI